MGLQWIVFEGFLYIDCMVCRLWCLRSEHLSSGIHLELSVSFFIYTPNFVRELYCIRTYVLFCPFSCSLCYVRPRGVLIHTQKPLGPCCGSPFNKFVCLNAPHFLSNGHAACLYMYFSVRPARVPGRLTYGISLKLFIQYMLYVYLTAGHLICLIPLLFQGTMF